jgi:hypothetical protein
VNSFIRQTFLNAKLLRTPMGFIMIVTHVMNLENTFIVVTELF